MQAVDELLWKWDTAYGRLHAAEAAYEASGCQTRPAHHLKKWRCRGALIACALAPRLLRYLHYLTVSMQFQQRTPYLLLSSLREHWKMAGHVWPHCTQ